MTISAKQRRVNTQRGAKTKWQKSCFTLNGKTNVGSCYWWNDSATAEGRSGQKHETKLWHQWKLTAYTLHENKTKKRKDYIYMLYIYMKGHQFYADKSQKFFCSEAVRLSLAQHQLPARLLKSKSCFFLPFFSTEALLYHNSEYWYLGEKS